MATVVEKTGIRREKGWLYFLDKRGDVSRARMARGGGKAPKRPREGRPSLGIEREDGFLYFIDKKGNVAKVKMKRSTARREAGAQEAGAPQDDGARAGTTARRKTTAQEGDAAADARRARSRLARRPHAALTAKKRARR